MAITIGRNPHSSIVVGEEYDIVSNDHAEIVQQGGDIVFTDHSSNGTIINGQKIQGRSVNIYPGDRILLAGIYELPWERVNRFITPVGRPTVARNIRGDNMNVERHTQPLSYPHQQEPHRSQPQRNSRITELMSEREHATLYGAPIPLQEQRKTTVNSAQIDKELSRWNWGAFYFGWIWGVFNKVYVSLVQLIVSIIAFGLPLIGLGVIAPIFSLISLGLSIWMGVKGSQLAWENGAFRNLDHFRTSRHNWNVAAAIVFGVSILLTIITLILFIDIIARIF